MYVYILKCKDDSYDVGVTNDIERRVREHNEGRNPQAYTFKRRPIELVYHEFYHDAISAIEAEKQLKGWSRKKKEALIAKNWERLHELAKCKNETSHENYHPSTSLGVTEGGEVSG